MRTVHVAGVEIPVLGFGTWRLSGDPARSMVAHAIDAGYRHIDTAAMYGNEREVGQGLRDSGVARAEVFVTTKLWIDAHASGALQTSAQQRLELLGLDQVDLLLLHWPAAAVPVEETIAALNEVLEKGWTRSIGVSNYPSALVDRAVAASKAPLATDQVEYHPFLAQRRLKATLDRHGMALTAYSPLAHGKVADDPTLKRIAERRGLTPAQVTLAWLTQQENVLAVPKTANPERARQNLQALSVELTPQEMVEISGLARPNGRLIDPDFAPQWDPAD